MHSPTLSPRRRALQSQQQPQRHRLNREQQQQGSTEFQQAADSLRTVASPSPRASLANIAG